MLQFRLSILAVAASLALAGADGIPGSWTAQITSTSRRAEQPQTVTAILEFRVEGDVLKGVVSTGGENRRRTAEILDGKVDGNRFSFTTVEKINQQERKFQWNGVLESGTLKGDRTREGARRSSSFTAVRR